MVPAALEQRRQRRHRRPAHADQVDALRLSQPATPPPPPAAADGSTTRTAVPSGSVTTGPVVCPEGTPQNTGPSKPAIAWRMASTAVRRPPGSSHPRISPNTTRAGAAQHARLFELRQHAMQPIRALVHVLEEEEAALGRREGVGRAERGDQRASACRRTAGRAPRRPGSRRPFRTSAPCRSAPRARAINDADVVAVRPAAEAPFQHRAVQRGNAAGGRSATCAGRSCRCSRRTASATARAPPASRCGSS